MPELLKNLYDRAFVEALAGAIHEVQPAFDSKSFIGHVLNDEWEQRELKQRMRHITHRLRAGLGEHYPAAIATLREAAQSPHLKDSSDYALVVFPDYIEVYGLNHWDESMAAIEQFTQQSTAEFAVRPFIERDTRRMMAQMLDWAQHASHHVRRLASEGCRPRLPWASALTMFKDDPAPILPVLDALRGDESLYVRRSVANNLNDISKDNPQITLETLTRWRDEPTPHLDWVTKHALRTLIKAGDRDALALLGYGDVAVRIENLRVEPDAVPMGGEIVYTFDVVSESERTQALLIDVLMVFAGKNGMNRQKVFKLVQAEIGAGERLTFSKGFSFQPRSTRRYYSGTQRLAIQVNGQVLDRVDFTLLQD